MGFHNWIIFLAYLQRKLAESQNVHNHVAAGRIYISPEPSCKVLVESLAANEETMLTFVCLWSRVKRLSQRGHFNPPPSVFVDANLFAFARRTELITYVFYIVTHSFFL